MSDLKKVWLTQSHMNTDQYCICLRFRDYDKYIPKLVYNTMTLPPCEEIDGKRLNINESDKLGLTEEHYNIFGLSQSELLELADCIYNYFLYGRS